jgi:uncharacterized protein with von Willebrand factor type A (vWA) domain
LVKEVKNLKIEKNRNSQKIDVAKPSSEADVSASNSIDATVKVGGNTADVEKELIVIDELVEEIENEKKKKVKIPKKLM